MEEQTRDDLTREELLSYVNSIALDDFRNIVSDAVLCEIVIDPWDKTICFSDGMSCVIGSAAGNAMYTSQFYLYIPEAEREAVSSKYETAVSELLVGATDCVKFSHGLQSGGVKKYVDVSLKVFSVDRKRYIVGFMVDRTMSLEEAGYHQIFEEDVNTYSFTYDISRDRCHLSMRFVQDFDLKSQDIDDFSHFYQQFVEEEDIRIIRKMFASHLNGDSVEGTTFRLLAPGRGEMFLRSEGMSSKTGADEKRCGGNYVSGVITDITDYIVSENILKNTIESAEAITFYADLGRERLTFSKELLKMMPDAPLIFEGDFVEDIAEIVVEEDKKRFRNDLHRAINEIGTDFSLEFRIRNKENKMIWVACRGKSYMDRSIGTGCLVGMLFDLTSMNEVKENIEKNQASNEITGLPGRERLIRDTDSIIRKKDVLSAAVILFDIHDFHAFNDRYGRTAGNEIVMAVASLLRETRPESAKIYHIGVDTFAVLWPDATQIKASDYMNDMQERFVSPLDTKQGSFFISMGLSAAFYPLGDTVDELLTNAEIALHKVKQNRKMKYAIYSPVDMHELKERVDFEALISQSVRNNMENFMLYYQPLVDARTGNLAGAEALLRFQLPSGETENPEKVVAALETTDQMSGVGEWILKEAISQCSQWIIKGAPEDFYVHINATADDLIRKDYARHVVELLNAYDLKPSNILIELTETSLMKNMSMCRKNLDDLKAMGIRTALDDFGSGYSSFNYLKELPVDEIKIDKTFVDDMETVEFDRSFISAMTMLAHSIGKKVVVEGVEFETQAEAIRQMGADIFQGYLFGKPMSVFAFWNQYFA